MTVRKVLSSSLQLGEFSFSLFTSIFVSNTHIDQDNLLSVVVYPLVVSIVSVSVSDRSDTVFSFVLSPSAYIWPKASSRALCAITVGMCVFVSLQCSRTGSNSSTAAWIGLVPGWDVHWVVAGNSICAPPPPQTGGVPREVGSLGRTCAVCGGGVSSGSTHAVPNVLNTIPASWNRALSVRVSFRSLASRETLWTVHLSAVS